MTNPIIIQGGMGVGVSSWLLANTVSKMGQLGVVSGTALDVCIERRLQLGDPDGSLKRAMDAFPVKEMADRVWNKFFIDGGKKADERFKGHTMFTMNPSKSLLELTVVANFIEVFLAKEGHDGVVGVNYLEKIQMPNLASIYGAMLAGVDYVLMGAGIPREIPGILDKYVEHEEATMSIAVEGSGSDDDYKMTFNPSEFFEGLPKLPKLKRPKFLAIIASTILAMTLSKKATGVVDGYIIEGPVAGGHNASPRGELHLNDKGEPIYGPKDEVDLKKVAAIGKPFWLAGYFGSPDKVVEAMDKGAAGVQVGSAFAFTDESGFETSYKQGLIKRVLNGTAVVFTDPKASPTGFPFKALTLEGSISEKEVYDKRLRVCDLGYLRHVYKKDDGKPGYRCPSEPVDQFVKKGGGEEETVGRKCLCNGLMSNIGLPQHLKDGTDELPFITGGDDYLNIARFIKEGETTYSAKDVVDYLLSKVTVAK